MNIIDASVELLPGQESGESMLRRIELAGRTCYKSGHDITDMSCHSFAQRMIDNGHAVVLEHASLSMRIICDRGVSHELVRHRLASYCQESTRYCNYSRNKFGNQITVVKPSYFKEGMPQYNLLYSIWYSASANAEAAYFDLLARGLSAQEARCVLPMSLKTEVVMTANLREWRHFLAQRTARGAHPQMREVATRALELAQEICPPVFKDIIPEA